MPTNTEAPVERVLGQILSGEYWSHQHTAASLHYRGDHTPVDPSVGFVTLDEWEARHIAFVLVKCAGNRRAAATQLGLARSTLLAKIRKYGLQDAGK